jgi:hypothetical protein
MLLLLAKSSQEIHSPEVEEKKSSHGTSRVTRWQEKKQSSMAKWCRDTTLFGATNPIHAGLVMRGPGVAKALSIRCKKAIRSWFGREQR